MASTSNKIVQEMIDRLRELQGSGEFIPVGRKVRAGTGLTGGGALTEDVTLSLSKESADALTKARGLSDVATKDDVARARTAMEAMIPARVVYRDFSVMDAPLSAVTAPPIRADEACTITRISVVAGAPGARPVVVTVAGKQVTLAAKTEATSTVVSIARSKGQSIPVSVGATDAAQIVVSVRCQERA